MRAIELDTKQKRGKIERTEQEKRDNRDIMDAIKDTSNSIFTCNQFARNKIPYSHQLHSC